MYRIIENDPFFEDIKSQKAKDNYNYLVDYLCSLPVPDKLIFTNSAGQTIVEDEIPLNSNYEEECLSFHKEFYSSQNLNLVDYILENRTKKGNSNPKDSVSIYGFSTIYDLDRDKILLLGSMGFYNSIAVMEHELIHLLLAINGNTPKANHVEILSIFGELLSLFHFSQKHNNPSIYENGIINRLITRMSYRVFTTDFSDEAIEEKNEISLELRKNRYPYMLGFIYAVRLLNIFHKNPNELISRINDVLSGKTSLESLLKSYNISLTDEDTCRDFIKFCDQYKDLVAKRYSNSELVSAR